MCVRDCEREGKRGTNGLAGESPVPHELCKLDIEYTEYVCGIQIFSYQ